MTRNTIKKQVQELAFGDIVIQPGEVDSIILGIMSHSSSSALPEVHSVRANVAYGNSGGGKVVTVAEYQGEVSVLAPTLTPAQEHADELLKLLRLGVAGYGAVERELGEESWAYYAEELIAKIDPQPPTLEEALVALALAREALDLADPDDAEGNPKGVADDLLNRARRAGVKV